MLLLLAATNEGLGALFFGIFADPFMRFAQGAVSF